MLSKFTKKNAFKQKKCHPLSRMTLTAILNVNLRYRVEMNYWLLFVALRFLLLGTAHEDGHRDGEGRVVDRLHEHGGRQLVQRLGHLRRVLDGLDHGGDERANVAVLARLQGLERGSPGGLLDLLLGVPHGGRHDRHDLVKGAREGRLGLLGELAEEAERPHLGLPVGLGDAREKEGLHIPGRLRAADGDDARAGLLGGIAHLLGLLVSDAREHVGQEGDHEGLGLERHDLAKGGDGAERGLRGCAVANLGLEALHHAALAEGADASGVDELGELLGLVDRVIARRALEGLERRLDVGRALHTALGHGRGHEIHIVEGTGLRQRLAPLVRPGLRQRHGERGSGDEREFALHLYRHKFSLVRKRALFLGPML